ncbi:isoquinoline 1-oxidoreductase beta subunit [Agrobacterium tumefaciens]|uniref:Isoquinoline 1-oxidoreductase beta subunit n=1 Tax=Agrobacterium radiobacter TaxID=362 RepID=A0ABR6JE28_AGRRD|nr:molybdopterin cofactor-binding domain-containing protein [Agrobacterium radiobacter]MBB4321270.1 isoquinoline 1-oxidoreductase beta subunit [Agrobacterium radiobacter]MBB4338310.1 isoquinoline 1-oxidoreductase beta subunit [Agrobacterium radiobacter]MBB4493198.1 isoquinoline 1-oxidoreductase beta subunit [Agrobacterium radiobacter]MBB4498471.1 isoquinoline 1-oxidoreductase beta subunit [Agrobacterium radiobacter]MBB4503830.1 isoquinoline 1-oxidoreductase beta subunit [Agrobacterium radiobac
MRREFLKTGAFCVAFSLASKNRQAFAKSATPVDAGNAAFSPNAFIQVQRDGRVRLTIPNVEMGQGIYTSEAAILAEEMDLGLDQIIVDHAPASPDRYTMPLQATQLTGGSTSIRGSWDVLRSAGATARLMLINAAASRWNVRPDSCEAKRGVVTHIQSGRSLDYAMLIDDAQRQTVPEVVPLKDRSKFTIIGKPWRRIDTQDKVLGATRFGIDAQPTGHKCAAVIMDPVWHARPRVENVPLPAGIHEIVALDDCLAVIADDFWTASEGARALPVEWDYGSCIPFDTAQLRKAMDHAASTAEALTARHDASWSGRPVTQAAEYEFPVLAHAALEPMNATVAYRKDELEIWIGTQAPGRVLDAAHRLTGFPRERIQVHNHYFGGGFGRRVETDQVEQAIRIAMKVDYPVKVIWSRATDIQRDLPRPPFLDRISAALADDGFPIEWTDHITGCSIFSRFAPQFMRENGVDPDTVDGADNLPYSIPSVHVQWTPFDMPDQRPIGWWRGVGPTHNLFRVECFLDELANHAGIDPYLYRTRLLQNNPRLLKVLHLAADKADWHRPLKQGVGRGIAVGKAYGSYVCAVVEVDATSTSEIRLTRCVCAVDCGIVINPNTIEAQIEGGLIFGWTAALWGELTYASGAVEQSNFHDYRLMRMNEVPSIAVHLVESDEHPSGVGELGTAIASPALANAVFHATGFRCRRLPLMPSLAEHLQSSSGGVLRRMNHLLSSFIRQGGKP